LADHLVFPETLRSAYPYAADGSPFWESGAAFPDPWITIGAMSSVTTQLRFSTNIYIAPARHPIHVAKSVATASAMSRGRVALGVGVGWMREEFDAVGEDFATRGRRLDEMIGILGDLWQGGMVAHHGRHYDFEALRLTPLPNHPIPIYAGGDSDAAMRRAARLDGWIGSLYTLDEAIERAGTIERMRREVGDPSDPDYEVFVALRGRPDDLDAYRRLADAGVTGVMVSPWWRALGNGRDVGAAIRDEIIEFGERVVAALAEEGHDDDRRA
jgi:probable F420-dependent oxidoreductase